jgi:putative PIN family toxin of toxin-antitoxin system
MRVVLDTNILLQAIANKSRLRPIWDAYLKERYELFFTSSILLEYEEKISEKTSQFVAFNVIALLSQAVNSVLIDVYYEWKMITTDEDDNKFIDAAIAGNADYLVTNDTHFNEAKLIDFPKVNIITRDEFLEILMLR